VVNPSRMDPSPKALSLVLLLCSLCAPCSPAEFCCGTVVPESPVLELGKTFTATCVLSEHGHQQTGATADDIYWEFANVTVDRKYYTKINESAVSVTVNVTQDLRSPLKCNVATRVLPRKNVHGIFFTVGYPPEKPNNLSCIVVQSGTNISSKMSCKWDRGARDPLLETTYIIHASFFNKHFSGTSTDKNHGELDFGVLPIYVIMNISVEVANKLGRISSDILTRDPLDFLKVNPPKDVTVSCEEAFPMALMVKWEHPLVSPEIPLLYNIRFSAAGTNVWSEISPDDIPSEISSFRLQNLKPNTVYAVQVRCMYFESKMYWSDWSESVMEKTPEDS
ncbi:interleukin-6 receptor subunit beta-like isoform X1, partial [Arapaima gigas]